MTKRDLFGLTGKAALVVGGGSGIGRATALMLADAGADVIVGDLDEARAKAVAAEVEERDVSSGAVTADVTTAEGAVGLVNSAVTEAGDRLDILINIVGLAAYIDLLGLDEATWDLEMSRNLRQQWLVAQAAARHMIDSGRGGRMAFVASVSGIYGAANHGAYGAAKAALMSLGRTMAIEWAPEGIRVNTVAPDRIATPRMRAKFDEAGFDYEASARDTIPLRRFGQPDDIAGALLFLVSDLSAFVTGQNIVVDGGRRAAFDLPKL